MWEHARASGPRLLVIAVLVAGVVAASGPAAAAARENLASLTAPPARVNQMLGAEKQLLSAASERLSALG